jgi:adenylate kinase family enzyme
VTLMNGIEPTDELRKELEVWVRTEIGPIAKPDLIQWAPGLPKTRSGKIMRRILRKIAEDDFGALGDTSTLAEPAVVDDLIENKQPASDGVCDTCGGTQMKRRADDNAETVRTRLSAYHAETAPLIDYYAARGTLTAIPAMGEIGEIAEAMNAIVSPLATA